MRLCEELKSSCKGCPELLEYPSALDVMDELIEASEGSEEFTFAELPAVFKYLRGGKSLSIPSDWREMVPNSLD